MSLSDIVNGEDTMNLRIFNTLSRKKEEFIPIEEGKIGIYVCGVTIYDHCHLGHAKNALSFDVINRYFKHKGLDITYICNITDVGHIVADADEGEDKVIRRAKERNVHPMELVDVYIKSMWEDFDKLKIDRPNISPRATGHIVEIIDAVKNLIDNNYAYEKSGSVYFDLDKFLQENPNTDSGKLSNRNLSKLKTGTRLEDNPDKKKPYDFALWKHAEPNHVLQWSSPWGKGYPGWHIECSVMATKYIGKTIDIHGGGIEHAMLHHECEIAQAEGEHHQKFVNYWVHVGLLNVEGTKMSKSLGNFITIKDALKKHTPEAIRLLISQVHYRSPLNYTEESINGAENAIGKILSFSESLKGYAKNPQATDYNQEAAQATKSFSEDFHTAMDDDFNTPRALGSFFSYMTQVNSYISEKSINAQNVEEITETVGLVNEIFKIIPDQQVQQDAGANLAAEIQKVREQLRTNKDYAASDLIRDALVSTGYLVQDAKTSLKK